MINVTLLIIETIALLMVVGLCVWLYNQRKCLIIKTCQLEEEKKNICSSKKSSEVRLGKVAEQILPFLSSYKYDPHRFRFIGDPIDGLQFNSDEIVFVEIKTGKSNLTSGQKNIKKLVEEGKIRFETFRIREDKTEII